VNYEAWGVMENFQGNYLGHAFFRACQYAIFKEIISKGLIYVSIKYTQTYLQISITWSKTLGKRKYEWMKACVITSLKPIKLNTLIKTK
jgi:CRISPR/Cas system CMR-associated protein Cmr5 small subunit